MIKVSHLDKYFNKGKQNSIHVIDDTTLEFSKNGLISLLGSSGSGKTTLLNVIGGLDKANGTIDFNGTVMKRYKSKTWDKIRANNVGYIFQNYYLLENKTIYENIKIVLNMIGIVDEKEVDYRVTYILKAVGMFRYRNKLASDLSGGQKQRVAIARALVKNPEVIIADEPTGNLDTNNSIEILKIIKEISKDRLVILVTHNTELAYHYSDRIIKITDGKVVSDEKDITNVDSGFSYDDKNIYLQDLNNFSSGNIKIYSDEPIEDLELTLVKINNNYYLKQNKANITIENIDVKKQISFVDAKKDEVESTFMKETSFSLNELEQVKTVRVKKRTFTFKDSLIEAFKKLANLGRRAKLQIIALVLLGVMFSIGSYTLLSTLKIDSSKVYYDRNLYQTDKYMHENISQIIADDNFIVYGKDDQYAQIFSWKILDSYAGLKTTILPLESLNNHNFYPNNNVLDSDNIYQVVIDETILDDSYSYKYMFESYGFYKKDHFIGQKLASNSGAKELIDIEIVGTVKTGTKAIYMNKNLITLLQANYNSYIQITENGSEKKDRWIGDYRETRAMFLEDDPTKYTIKEGEVPTDQFGNIRIVVSEKISAESIVSLNQSNYIVTGFFEDSDGKNISKVYVNIDDLYSKRFGYDYTNYYYYQTYIYSIDGSSPNDVENFNVYLTNLYDDTIAKLEEQKTEKIASSLVQIIISLVISALIFYFLVRSSLTKRIKEVSILRSLGVGKREVGELFLYEYIILTTFTSLFGVLFGTVVANSLSSSYLSDLFKVRTEPLFIVITIAGIYLVNVLIAMIPVLSLLRKTPAQMLTNYDM